MTSIPSHAPTSQLSIQQLLQKATSPTPHQSDKNLLQGLQNGSKPETHQQQGLNTSGHRGTLLNVTA